MTIHDSNSNRIFNQELDNIFGFYQILDTGTVTFLGRHNAYYIICVFLVVYECLFSAILFLNGLYYLVNNNDMVQAMFYFAFVGNALYGVYKMYIILNHSKVIRDCMSITKFDFTSYGVQGRQTLNVWRNNSIKYTNIYTIYYVTLTALCLACPVVFNDSFIIIKKHGGLSSAYRLNLINLYLFVSGETYNTYFYVFYIVEMLAFGINALFVIIFDTTVNTLAFALIGQLQMISTAFESVGHETLHFPNNNTDNKIELPNENIKYMDLYDDLKKLIIDHQNILKKYDEFLSIFRPTMLLQVFVLSYSIIFLWFIFFTNFMEADFMQYTALISVKALFGIAFCTAQVYVPCFVFSTLNTKKDSITFALYSSNWTEMDMKFKKLILLTMRMNSAHQQKLQYTRTRIIDMEIFYYTMRVCYTVINAMINCKKEKLVQQ